MNHLSDLPLSATQFGRRIVRWYDQHGRKDLPWQQTKTAYRVWVSEIMLQQTQVATVIDYYQRFMQRFPDVVALASAAEDEVLHYWAGLGYYARARHLQRCAQIIVADFAGEFPADLAQLQCLPGIGRSTAGAIMALAWEQPAAILDGNVKRVLTRFLALSGWPGSTAVQQYLWQVAEHYVPNQRVAAYTQALMDLGATLCTRRQPQCERCPLGAACVAYQQGRQHDYPEAKPKKTLPVKHTVMLLLKNQHGDIYLQKRPAPGIWGGLWSFPECDDMHGVADWVSAELGGQVQQQQVWPILRHSFSHYHLSITPVVLTVAIPYPMVQDSTNAGWYAWDAPWQLGLATPVKRLLAQWREQ